MLRRAALLRAIPILVALASSGPSAGQPAAQAAGRSVADPDGSAVRQLQIKLGWPNVPAGRWGGSMDLQIGPLSEPTRGETLKAVEEAAGHGGDAPSQSMIGALMRPIGSSHPRLRPYTELTLASRGVLVRGDLVTLQAGSDLHLVLQQSGLAPWAGEAAAMIGWHSHMQLRWSRSSDWGEFSMQARVDRRADQLGRGLVEMRWQGHL